MQLQGVTSPTFERIQLQMGPPRLHCTTSALRLQAWHSCVLQDSRGVFSFCMCPGGQVVPTSTSADELCVNGMSFR